MAISWTPDGSFLPMDRGWNGWVKRPNLPPDQNGDLKHGANGSLSFVTVDGTMEMVGLWVNDLTFNFGMNGQNVQSKSRRSFFPHNFTAPTATFAGQCPNQYEYNRLAQFIRQAQLNYMRGIDLDFNAKTGTPAGKGLRLTIHDPHRKSTSIDRRQRGSHGGFDAFGYILNAPAGAERWVNAPTYSLQFTVTDVVGGNWLNSTLQDLLVHRSQLEDITGLFLKHADFVKPPKPPKRTTGEHHGHGLPPKPPKTDNPTNNPFGPVDSIWFHGDGLTPTEIVGD